LPILAQKLSRIGDWGGSNLDANSLQSGSVLDAIQHITGHCSGGSEFNNYGTVGYTLEQKLEVLKRIAI
jgi:hypothetical protein